MNLNILASDDTATFEITHMDAPVVSTKKASSLAQLTALAGGLIAGLGVPFGGSWGHRSGTNNGKSHSSAAQRRSPYYQPTGDDRMKLEQAEAKRKRKQRAARLARG